MPLLVERMTDVNTNQETRTAILDWTAATLAGGSRMDIAGQADYAWPDALKKQAREALQKIDRRPQPLPGLARQGRPPQTRRKGQVGRGYESSAVGL